MRLRVLSVGLAALVFCLIGCNTLFRGTPEVVPGYTNAVVSVQPDGSLVTNIVSRPTVTVTNWVKGEAFDVIEASGGLVPVYGEVAVAVLGLAGTIYLGWLNRKHKKVGVSTIQGIGQFRTILQASGERGVALDGKLKGILKKAHWQAGVKEVVDNMIEVHVGKHDQPEMVKEVKNLL